MGLVGANIWSDDKSSANYLSIASNAEGLEDNSYLRIPVSEGSSCTSCLEIFSLNDLEIKLIGHGVPSGEPCIYFKRDEFFRNAGDYFFKLEKNLPVKEGVVFEIRREGRDKYLLTLNVLSEDKSYSEEYSSKQLVHKFAVIMWQKHLTDKRIELEGNKRVLDEIGSVSNTVAALNKKLEIIKRSFLEEV
ncbi:MAG: hypothetical protein JW791_01815 [Nanoarchaeota archaeon]|nr:hypothetical protein [Nanoarchaeota archaeon]